MHPGYKQFPDTGQGTQVTQGNQVNMPYKKEVIHALQQSLDAGDLFVRDLLTLEGKKRTYWWQFWRASDDVRHEMTMIYLGHYRRSVWAAQHVLNACLPAPAPPSSEQAAVPSHAPGLSSSGHAVLRTRLPHGPFFLRPSPPSPHLTPNPPMSLPG